MNIQLLSDIHLEFADFRYEENSSDVVVLAGDIHVKNRGVEWAITSVKNKPVIYVLGNHEFYGKSYPKHIQTLQDMCVGTNVHVLENEMITIDGVNFLGATLWTNFELYGDPRLNGSACQEIMTDFKKIRVSPKFRRIKSLDISVIHRQSLKWIEATLDKVMGQKNVVVTHHGPSEKSLPDTEIGNNISSAYVSSLEDTILNFQPTLWLHGHLHNTSEYKIGDCRVRCNPRGYPDEPNPDFQPKYQIKV